MNEQKLRTAFKRIKADMEFLTEEIHSLKINNSLNDEIKLQIEDIKKLNLEKFVTTIETELKSVEIFVGDFNKKLDRNSEQVSQIKDEIKNYSTELKKLNKEIVNSTPIQVETKRSSKKSEINLDLRFDEFQELMNEKVSMEISGLKLEFFDELNSLRNENKNLNQKVLNLEIDLKNASFSNEKKSIIENEKQEIIAKEKPLLKSSKKNPSFKKIEDDSFYSSSNSSRKAGKSSKLKKMKKWLFEEDEDTLDSIKDAVNDDDDSKDKSFY